jgi:nucleotide-binding universal stress UspA family protein
MSYKVMLVHLDKAPLLAATVAQAADIAASQGAHVIGLAAAAAALEVPPAEAFSVFSAAMRRAGVASFEERLIQGDAASGIAALGSYADLILLGRREPGDPNADVHAAFCEFIAMNCGCPVLMTASTGHHAVLPRRALIAWNGSTLAARAVRAALPLLRAATEVRLATINAPAGSPGAESGILVYLGRHGINAEAVRQTVDIDAGHALLSLADTLSSDMLVLGFHAHPQFDDVLHRGVTRTVLEAGKIAALMCR